VGVWVFVCVCCSYNPYYILLDIVVPIVAILTRFLSLRTLQWIGGGTILCGICLSSFTTNNVELILSYGLLTGKSLI